jgi:hypothetical protein
MLKATHTPTHAIDSDAHTLDYCAEVFKEAVRSVYFYFIGLKNVYTLWIF